MCPIELLENPFQVARPDALALIADLNPHKAIFLAGGHPNFGAGRGVLGSIVEQIEQYLLEEDRIQSECWQEVTQVDHHPMPGQNLAGPPQRTADDIADIAELGLRLERTGFQPCHVEQIRDEAIEAFGLFLDCSDEFVLGCLTERLTIILQACRGAQNGGKRRAQIVRNRGQQCRAQPLRFGRHPDLLASPARLIRSMASAAWSASALSSLC